MQEMHKLGHLISTKTLGILVLPLKIELWGLPMVLSTGSLLHIIYIHWKSTSLPWPRKIWVAAFIATHTKNFTSFFPARKQLALLLSLWYSFSLFI